MYKKEFFGCMGLILILRYFELHACDTKALANKKEKLSNALWPKLAYDRAGNTTQKLINNCIHNCK